MDSISDKLNPFWKDILLNLSELLPIKDEEENNIRSICVNSFGLILILKEMVFFLLLENIVIMVSFFINDIVSDDKQFLSYDDNYKLSIILWYCGCSR